MIVPGRLAGVFRREWAFMAAGALWLALASGALRELLPAALYLVPLCILGTTIIGEVLEQRRPVRRWLLGLTVLCGVMQLLIWQARGAYVPNRFVGWLDDWSYWQECQVIADHWMRGMHPILSNSGGVPNLGTLHTAWHRILAAWSLVVGRSPQGLLSVNLLFLLVVPSVAFACGRDLAILTGLRKSPRAGLITAGLVTMYPSTYYYGSFLLKDLATGAVGLLALRGALGILVHRPGAWLYYGAALFWLVPLRAYAGLALFLALAVAAASRLKLWWALRLGAWGLVGVYCVWLSDRGAYLEQLVLSLVNNMPQDLLLPMRLVSHYGIGTIRVFLAPYPWVAAEGNFPNYEVYFGQWYLFLIGYPLAVAGLWRLARVNRVGPAMPMIAVVLGLSVLILAYGGNVTRQRYFVDLWVLVLSGLGMQEEIGVRRWATALVMTGIGLFAGAQLTRLFLSSVVSP